MHWKTRVMMLLRVTSCSTLAPSPSARPLSRSRATIMKSLSGASYWSGCWLYICTENRKKTSGSEEWSRTTTLRLFILHGPWLERGSSGPGWHSAGKLVHSRAGSRSVVLWPLKTGTKRRKSNKLLKTSPFFNYEYNQKKILLLPPTKGTDPCLHLLTHSISE